MAAPAFHLVHRREPLRRGAIDDRRLVPPAMHVAVHELRAVQERADLAQLVDDVGIGRPDLLSTEERERLGETSVALHRTQDLVVTDAIAPARQEVLDTVCRRAVHDAGTLIERDVVAQEDRRWAIVEGMTKADALERRALGERD